MNCCKKQDQSDKKAGYKGPIMHLVMMILCCGLPVVILLLLPAIGTLIPRSAQVIGSIASFLCPIMMMLMIPMMLRGRKGKQACSEHSELLAADDHEKDILVNEP